MKHVEGGLVNFQEDTIKDLFKNRIKLKIKKNATKTLNLEDDSYTGSHTK